MHPGCCALCGSGNCDDGYVNTGIYYDYEGQMYLCNTCAIQVAEVIGCLSPDETVHLQGLLSDTAKELASVKAELEANNERLNDYDALLLGALTASDFGLDSPSGDTIKAESEPADAEPGLTDGTPVLSDDGESDAKESVKSVGRRKPPRTQRSDSGTSDGLTI
jgi:hypothetical protein